jgi:hypothetical protein
VEALQILKFSIQQDRGLNFTAGYHWDDEIKDLENNVEIPEDMDAFISILKS